jgi:RimJ/RimL family protein N-acetyltransferase
MGLRIRPAMALDADLLFEWRQADERNDWWQGKPVEWEKHLDWLVPRLLSPVVDLWVGEVDGVPVGQARLDSNGELAFSVDKDFRGRGYGTELVKKATLAAKSAGWGRVKACVDSDNEASTRTLMNAGYAVRPDVRFMRWPS